MSTTAGNTVDGISLPENVSVLEMIHLAINYFHAHICSSFHCTDCRVSVTCMNRVGIEVLR